jgi:protein SCO1
MRHSTPSSRVLVILPLMAALAAGCRAREPAAGSASSHDDSHTAHAPAPAAAPPEEHHHHEHHTMVEAAGPVATESIYNLHATLTEQAGATLGLDAFRGQPVLMTMFYASCTSICPMLIGHLQRIDGLLPEAVRAQTRVLLVSLDPERDTVEQLTALAKLHGIDSDRWHFTRTPSASVQEIAALLGVRYRRMLDGEISHSPVIVVLDRNGVIARRVEAPLGDPKELVTTLEALSTAPQ